MHLFTEPIHELIHRIRLRCSISYRREYVHVMRDIARMDAEYVAAMNRIHHS